MRETKETKTFYGMIYRTFTSGEIQVISQGNVSYVDYVQRSDITRVTPVNGFRQPTDYFVKESRGDPTFQGEFSYIPWDSPGNGVWTLESTYGMYAATTLDLSLPSTNDLNRAEIQTLLKVKDQKVNLSVVFAETHKSVDLVVDRSLKIYRSLKALKKGQFAAAARALGVNPKGKPSKDLSKAWLELQYGWMPLLQDIHGAYELARSKFNTYGLVMTARSVVKSDTSSSTFGQNVDSGQFKMDETDVTKDVTRVSLSYRVNSEALRAATASGLPDPLMVAWETMPWSFVIDWALPVGNWIEALTATAGLTFLGGSNSRMRKRTRLSTLYATGKWSSTGTGSTTQVKNQFQRSTYGSSPFPVPYYKSPFSVMHGLNAFALLRSLK